RRSSAWSGRRCIASSACSASRPSSARPSSKADRALIGVARETSMKVIVCGAGQVGSNIARYLSSEGSDVTIIDSQADLVEKVTDSLDVPGVVGFASHPEVLEKAGARDADLLIAVTFSDEVN